MCRALRLLLLPTLILISGVGRPAEGGDPDRVGLFSWESNYYSLSVSEEEWQSFQFGFSHTAFIGPTPFAGDFDGDGMDSIGFHDWWNHTFEFRNSNTEGPADATVVFGTRWYPVVGDFDGDGIDTIGDYGTGEFSLRNSNTPGPPDHQFSFGPANALPLVGDFDGDGVDTIGAYDPSNGTFHLRNANSPGPAHWIFPFGPLDSWPVIGDFDGDGVETVGVLEAATGEIHLRNSNSAGPADQVILLDPVDWSWIPIAGNWTTAPPPPPVGYAWPTADPADHGFDPVLLDEAYLAAGKMDFVHSLLVVRDGRLLQEEYFGGFTPDLAGNVKSVSKSLLSALVGIAIKEGHIDGWNQGLAPFFPDRFSRQFDSARSGIRISHLVTMKSGLFWNEADLASMIYSPDWIDHVLDQPVVAAPGAEFLYSTGLTHLMSRILIEATGEQTSDYARTRLFQPLGIRAVRWDRDPQGNSFGGAELYMVPRDLARFGFHYLTLGSSSLKSIVPHRWMTESVSELVPAGEIDGDLSYGAWWWRKSLGGHDDVYFAWGYGGQFLFNFPSLDLIVVLTSRWNVTGAESTAQSYAIFDLLEDSVLPALVE